MKKSAFYEKNIQDCRNAAIKVLKLSRKDLEHGLELHENSAVFDAFCLGFPAPVDGLKLKQAMLGGATASEIRAMTARMSHLGWAAPGRKEFLRLLLRASGLTGFFQNVEFDGAPTGSEQFTRLAYYSSLVQTLPNIYTLADTVPAESSASAHPTPPGAGTPSSRSPTTPNGAGTPSSRSLTTPNGAGTPSSRSLRENRGEGTPPPEDHSPNREPLNLFFSMNHVPLAYEFKSVSDELRYLELCRNFGVRMMHLTYNRQNMLGGGCYECADGGLSDFGRKTLRRMNELGIIPDIAHCGWRTSEDAARVSNAPVVASHTACCGLHEHPRGKPNRVLKAIAASGGYIGICCIPSFLGGRRDISAMLDHVVYAVKKVGADHVAIGTDRNFSGSESKREAKKYPRPSKFFNGSMPPPFESGFEFGCGDQEDKPEHLKTMELVNWPIFTAGLVQRGLKDDVVKKIIGGNVMRLVGNSRFREKHKQ